ncbi:hypothetical protein Ciccas_004179 [Cichlidogyrus casuarinus]|uniref:Ig-like domain-containing protein n=1 Tax=Cichlidogyrus casuarinus TaxID=1844966 RepID=A0ABD2QC84_9PLAT
MYGRKLRKRLCNTDKIESLSQIIECSGPAFETHECVYKCGILEGSLDPVNGIRKVLESEFYSTYGRRESVFKTVYSTQENAKVTLNCLSPAYKKAFDILNPKPSEGDVPVDVIITWTRNGEILGNPELYKMFNRQLTEPDDDVKKEFRWNVKKEDDAEIARTIRKRVQLTRTSLSISNPKKEWSGIYQCHYAVGRFLILSKNFFVSVSPQQLVYDENQIFLLNSNLGIDSILTEMHMKVFASAQIECSVVSLMMAETLLKLFSCKIIYHDRNKQNVPYFFEKELGRALSMADIVISCDDKFALKKQWESVKSSVLHVRILLGAKKLELLKEGAHLISTTRVKIIDLEALHVRIRQNKLGSLCLNLPLECDEAELKLAEEISELDNCVVLPPSSSYHCTPKEDLDIFIRLIIKPIREHFYSLNDRVQGSYRFLEDIESASMDQVKKNYSDKLNEILHSTIQFLNSEKDPFKIATNLKTRLKILTEKSMNGSNRRKERRRASLTRSTSMENIPEIDSSLCIDSEHSWIAVKKEIRRLTTAPLVSGENSPES